MIDEQACRRPTYVEGVRIRLADGQSWSLPAPPPHPEDQEHLSLLQAIAEAEDEAERLRAELALTILLLSRNYQLGPDVYESILTFVPGDPALAEVQAAVSALGRTQLRSVQRVPASRPRSTLLPPVHWRLANLLKRTGRTQSS